VILPNAERAVIERAKLRDYLLSRTHPVGRFKATFFRSLGYEARRWKRLEADIRAQHLPRPTRELPITPYGRKYVIRATLVGPSGKSAAVASVWIMLANEDFPRFVTAYPA
jgi:hypothetical protein